MRHPRGLQCWIFWRMRNGGSAVETWLSADDGWRMAGRENQGAVVECRVDLSYRISSYG